MFCFVKDTRMKEKKIDTENGTAVNTEKTTDEIHGVRDQQAVRNREAEVVPAPPADPSTEDRRAKNETANRATRNATTEPATKWRN